MSPRRKILCQCAPPSCVAYSPGPYSHPSRAPANTTPLTLAAWVKLLPALLKRRASGAFRKCQCAPPPAVATSRALHALPPAQPAPPRTTPRAGDRKLAQTGSKAADSTVPDPARSRSAPWAAPAAPAAAGPDAASAAPTAATHNPRVSVPFMHGHPFPGPGRGSLHGQDRTPHAAAAHRTLP